MAKNFKDNFSDIFEELEWQFFVMSKGNPYIIHDIVKRRTWERENMKNDNLGMTKS